jgi:hypothetical protein
MTVCDELESLYFITSSGDRASRCPEDETKKHVLEAE